MSKLERKSPNYGESQSYTFSKTLTKNQKFDSIFQKEMKKRPLRKPKVPKSISNEINVKKNDSVEIEHKIKNLQKPLLNENDRAENLEYVEEQLTKLGLENTKQSIHQDSKATLLKPDHQMKEIVIDHIEQNKSCNSKDTNKDANKKCVSNNTCIEHYNIKNEIECQINTHLLTSDINDKNCQKKKKNLKRILIKDNNLIRDEKQHESKTEKSKKRKLKKYPKYMPVDRALTLLKEQGTDDPLIISGNLRINPRFNQHAYVSVSSDEEDVLIIGCRNRNRALDGDKVIVRLNDPEDWYKLTDDMCQKTGYVICVLEKIHPRKTVGFLSKQGKTVTLQPRDSRLPLIKIKNNQFLQKVLGNINFETTIVAAIITDWVKCSHAEGEIDKIIGIKGNLESESQAILIENDLYLEPYENQLLSNLPPDDYTLTEKDIIGREDLRNWCIFTIDPATSVDLDDALSCNRLVNGNFEVGVHISDVTHFLLPFSPLDRIVAERATSVYMVDRVYHMLPKQLCDLCSLSPGQDKLAFSVIFEITPHGQVIRYRFSKTIINSCCKMSYEQAQLMIENPLHDWENFDALRIFGKYNPLYISNVVNSLHKVATLMRTTRFHMGALRIDQPKIIIGLDPETGIPNSFKMEEKKDSNSLVEEFMLLANTVVAKQLYESYPEVALLRSHAKPSKKILSRISDTLKTFGIILDIESAGHLHHSLVSLYPHPETPPPHAIAAQHRNMVINSLCAKSMMRAVYRCSSTAISLDDLKHYALNVDFYTHFTSPIRRYPDCIVHRLLFLSISHQPIPPAWNPQLCSKLAANCNLKKYSAKMAQEQSTALFFTYHLSLQGPINMFVIVMEVKERSVDALMCDFGLKIRLYFADCPEEHTVKYIVEHDMPTIHLTWTKYNLMQKITLFTILYVQVSKNPKLFKLHGTILPFQTS